jgi:pimeloyl-ACP methyl ester carboxylesterase
MRLFFDDADFDAQFQRTLAHACELGADLGECLAVAGRITPGDHDSWSREWSSAAEHLRQLGEVCLGRHRRTSAREAFLRAGEYFRAAYYFRRGDLDDPGLLAGWRNGRACFRRAATLFDHPCEAVRIPYEGTALCGYFLSPDRSGTARATVVGLGGDGPVEELYFLVAAPALRRGYHCLIFEGPGQGGSLYEKRLFFRPDYEVVLTAVVDYLLTRPDVDGEQLALVGRGFGGYLAARAVTAEHRVAALVADPGQMGPDMLMRIELPPELLRGVLEDDPAMDRVFEEWLREPHRRASYGSRLAAHGAKAMRPWLRSLTDWTLEGLERSIRCPTLVTANDADPMATTARRLYQALTCPKRSFLFHEADGAGGPCEGLGQLRFHQVAFDWLDEVLGHRP